MVGDHEGTITEDRFGFDLSSQYRSKRLVHNNGVVVS
jgi:hypothetical protein